MSMEDRVSAWTDAVLDFRRPRRQSTVARRLVCRRAFRDCLERTSRLRCHRSPSGRLCYPVAWIPPARSAVGGKQALFFVPPPPPGRGPETHARFAPLPFHPHPPPALV